MIYKINPLSYIDIQNLSYNQAFYTSLFVYETSFQALEHFYQHNHRFEIPFSLWD